MTLKHQHPADQWAPVNPSLIMVKLEAWPLQAKVPARKDQEPLHRAAAVALYLSFALLLAGAPTYMSNVLPMAPGWPGARTAWRRTRRRRGARRTMELLRGSLVEEPRAQTLPWLKQTQQHAGIAQMIFDRLGATWDLLSITALSWPWHHA